MLKSLAKHTTKKTKFIGSKKQKTTEKGRGKMKKMNKVLNEENDTPAPIHVYVQS